MDVVNEVLEKTSKESEKYKTTTVQKHLELDFDLGALLASDPNELNNKSLQGNRDEYILQLTRGNTQLLFNKIWELPTDQIEEVIVAKLPPRRTVLPRSKPVPRPRPLTKWQQFAKEKGIQKKKKSKLSWDEQLEKWVPLYGYRRDKAQKDKDWVLEVPDNANPMEDQFEKKAVAKSERVAKNELQRLRNIAKAKNVKVPRVGFLNPDVSTAKDLQMAVTVAKASTASLGKFQPKLPHEKEARGVAALTPGASRKRKLAPVPAAQEKSENLNIVESVLNKRPKLSIEKAVSRHINEEQVQRSEQKRTQQKRSKTKSGKKKPKGGKGRKRR